MLGHTMEGAQRQPQQLCNHDLFSAITRCQTTGNTSSELTCFSGCAMLVILWRIFCFNFSFGTEDKI